MVTTATAPVPFAIVIIVIPVTTASTPLSTVLVSLALGNASLVRFGLLQFTIIVLLLTALFIPNFIIEITVFLVLHRGSVTCRRLRVGRGREPHVLDNGLVLLFSRDLAPRTFVT